MSEDSDADKTEDPSAHKLQEARKKGQVPRTREVGQLMTIVSGIAILALVGPWMVQKIISDNSRYIAMSYQLPADKGGIGSLLLNAVFHLLAVLAIPFALLWIMAIIGGMIPNGLIVSFEQLKPKFDKFNPLSGLKKIFGPDNLIEMLKSIIKITVVGAVAMTQIMPAFDAVEHYIELDLVDLVGETTTLALQLMLGVAIAILILAGFDYFYQRFRFMQQMRMTVQEMREEYKQLEGDPHVKGRIKQLRLEKGRQRMMANVPKSDVVITNPTHYAVALKYDPSQMDAPQLMAKGVDAVAARIRALAEENKIPIVRNPPLARALYAACDIEENVPMEHYRAVAQVISYVFRLKGRKMQ
jgi:flagellar biosynthesis protein FlhB